MDIIKTFCKDAIRVSVSTKETTTVDKGSVNFDLKNDEVWRTRHYSEPDMGCLFDFKLNLHQNITLTEEIGYMRTIEMFYPGVFSWRFTGKHIECIGKMSMKKEYLGVYSRYRDMYGFIKLLRDRLLEILKFRNYTGMICSEKIKGMLLSTGSINSATELYVVDILPTDSEMDILSKSKDRIITDGSVKEFDMKFWVKEINPDYYRGDLPKPKNINKIPITGDVFKLYPPCITQLCGLKRKGNYNRFLLSIFFLATHHERDAKYQLNMVLSDDEKEHVLQGNCKDQWRAIVSKGYSAPSCKTMIENGFCPNDCGRAFPHYIAKEEQK